MIHNICHLIGALGFGIFLGLTTHMFTDPLFWLGVSSWALSTFPVMHNKIRRGSNGGWSEL